MVKYINYLTCALCISRASVNAVRYNKTHFITGERNTPREETNLLHPENCGLKKLWQYLHSQEDGVWMAEAIGTKTSLFFNERRWNLLYKLHREVLLCTVGSGNLTSELKQELKTAESRLGLGWFVLRALETAGNSMGKAGLQPCRLVPGLCAIS